MCLHFPQLKVQRKDPELVPSVAVDVQHLDPGPGPGSDAEVGVICAFIRD